MEIPWLFFPTSTRSSGCWTALLIHDIRQVEAKQGFRSSEGGEFVATFSGTSPAESTAGQGCDLCVSKWRRRPFFKKPMACPGRVNQGDIFRRQARQARGAGGPERAAPPWAARSRRPRSAS
uniref:Uncharacterized protein n=1 Tax=Molossus molossus TaxID=27622 RepID=A0A7J8ERW8_MOLMO|nr:hypothetical protein HJG59_008751 [Molossus molossus]